MAENATKVDIERLVNLMQMAFARIDERLAEMNARMHAQALRSEWLASLLQLGNR